MFGLYPGSTHNQFKHRLFPPDTDAEFASFYNLASTPKSTYFHSPLTQHHSLSLGQTIGNRLALNITYITSDAANIKIACEHSHCSQQLYLADEEASTPVRSAWFQSSSLTPYCIWPFTQTIANKVRIYKQQRIIRSLCPHMVPNSRTPALPPSASVLSPALTS